MIVSPLGVCVYSSLEEAELLSDPYYQSGYRNVYLRGNKYFVDFTHHFRQINEGRFRTATAAASFIIRYFKQTYGDDWMQIVSPDSQQTASLIGPGWKIQLKNDGGCHLDVCPCGTWCRVRYRRNGRATDVFTSPNTAKKALNSLNRHVWPLYGRRILEPTPYRTPKKSVVLPATQRKQAKTE